MYTETRLIPCLADNYAALVRDPATGAVAVVDVPDADAVQRELAAAGWRLTDILITHHHADHTQGLAALKAATGARVTGPREEADRIAGLDRLVGEDDAFAVGAIPFQVIATPGHTRGHVAYWSRDAALLFAGDTLFAMGCGRVIEGTTDQMWASLQKLAALPPKTDVYCGHEYTEKNGEFALSIDPDYKATKSRMIEVKALRRIGRPTVPTSIGWELATNPFLRATDAKLAGKLGLSGAEPALVFAELRARKDGF